MQKTHPATLPPPFFYDAAQRPRPRGGKDGPATETHIQVAFPQYGEGSVLYHSPQWAHETVVWGRENTKLGVAQSSGGLRLTSPLESVAWTRRRLYWGF